MRKIFLLIYTCFLISFSALYSAETKKTSYGEPGGFELSTGLSVVNTSNRAFNQNYSIGLLPYANHFILKNWFLRYDLGLIYQYSILYSSYPQYAGQYSEVWTFAVNPGLGLGYSFDLHERWRINFSGGYQYGYVWTSSTYSGFYSYGGGNIVFSPELKYLVTDHWILTLLARINTNLVDLIAGNERKPSISTNIYVVASYYFP